MQHRVIQGEVPADFVESVIAALPSLPAIYSADHVLLIHGKGSAPRGLYMDLKRNDAVEVIWSGWCLTVWWTHLLRFIAAGHAGLVRVLNRSIVDQLYLKIGTMSLCALYFVPKACEQTIIANVLRARTCDVDDLLEGESNYFLLDVDFDYRGEHPESFFRKVVIGSDLDAEIASVLSRQPSCRE